MNTATSKLIRAFVIIVVLVFFVSNIYNSLKDKIETEEAVSYSVNENVVFDGVFVRNETIIEFDVDGVVEYVYPDGSKLSNSSVVANVYENEQQIYAKKKIRELEAELAQLQHSQNPGTTNYAKPETIKTQIDEKYMTLAAAIERQDMETVKKTKSDITVLMNIYDVVTQKESDYKAREQQIEEEINKFQSQYKLPKSVISPRDVGYEGTGYFISTTDGFENAVSIDTIDTLTSDKIQQIVKGEGSQKFENAIGKICDSYECMIVGVIKPTNKFLKGDSLKIRVDNSDNIYQVTVYDIIKESDDKWLVVLNCDAIDKNISAMRVEKIELIFKEFTGLKVPREAITFKEVSQTVQDENGNDKKVTEKQKGVYVKLGQEIVFKKINVIYEGDGFVISENVSDSNYLNLYDQIIMEEVKKDDDS